MHRLTRVTVLIGLLSTFAASSLLLAQEVSPFAELSITAHGAQRLDLATGFTEFLDGATVVDRGSGVQLEAPWLRYLEGERLEALDAVAEGTFGRVAAREMMLDLVARELRADGGITLETRNGTVVAQTLRFEAAKGWLLALGGVRSDRPELEAEGVWYESDGGRLLVLPPYQYQDGPVRLRADAAGAPLQLTPAFDADGALLGYDASTDLDEDVAARLPGVDGG